MSIVNGIVISVFIITVVTIAVGVHWNVLEFSLLLPNIVIIVNLCHRHCVVISVVISLVIIIVGVHGDIV